MRGRSSVPLSYSIQRLVLALEWNSNSNSCSSPWVVLQATDGFVAERDALAGQLLVVGQQIALSDQQPHR